MSQTIQLTEQQRQYAKDVLHGLPFSKLIGMRLEELELGVATIAIEMRDELRHPGGVLHGGVTATLIDTAMAFAIRTYLTPDAQTATIDLTVHYLRPHTEGRFVCTARVVRPGKRLFNVAAEVFNEEQKLIATGVSNYTVL